MDAAAGPRHASGIHLLAVLPQLWGALGPGERRAVRAVCRAACTAADPLFDQLHVSDFHRTDGGDDWRCKPPAEEREVVSSVTRFLRRGGRPHRLVLRLRARGRKPEDTARIGVAVLATFAELQQQQQQQQLSGEPGRLSRLRLQGVPLTPDLAAAVVSAAPSLQRLKLDLGFMPAPGRASNTATVSKLLCLVGPHLQRLTLENGPSWGTRESWGGLQKAFDRCSMPCVLKGLEQLPHLRSLKLCRGPRAEYFLSGGGPSTVANATVEALRRLTGLTRLVTQGLDASPLVPALRRLRGLAELRVEEAPLRLDSLAQLSGLSSLTRLEVSELVAAQPAVNRRSGPAPSGGHVPLPPAVRELVSGSLLEPAVLLALQLPPSLVRLQLFGLDLADGGGASRARQASAAAKFERAVDLASTACGMLAGRFDDQARVRPFKVHSHTSPECPAVPGGFTKLIVAMRPLGLRRLYLHGPWVQDCDVKAIARELTGLEDLQLEVVDFTTPTHNEALPLLGRLSRLERLELQFRHVPCAEMLLELCSSAPSLRKLLLSFEREAADDMHAVIGSVQEAVRRQGRQDLVVDWA